MFSARMAKAHVRTPDHACAATKEFLGACLSNGKNIMSLTYYLLIPVSIISVNISKTASGLISDPVYRVVLFPHASQQNVLFHSVSGLSLIHI